jgi:hypothetical protein
MLSSAGAAAAMALRVLFDSCVSWLSDGGLRISSC